MTGGGRDGPGGNAAVGCGLAVLVPVDGVVSKDGTFGPVSRTNNDCQCPLLPILFSALCTPSILTLGHPPCVPGWLLPGPKPCTCFSWELLRPRDGHHPHHRGDTGTESIAKGSSFTELAV